MIQLASETQGMAGMAPACPSAISNPVATCWGRYLWQYDILGPLLERQR